MAAYYVDSHATGGNSGNDWANAFTSLVSALAIGPAKSGDTFYVSHDHVESTSASMNLSCPYNAPPSSSMTKIICVNKAGSVPPVLADLRTTAYFSTSVAGSNISITENYPLYVYGVKLETVDGAFVHLSSGGYQVYYKKCILAASTVAGDPSLTGLRLTLNPFYSTGGEIVFDDVTIVLKDSVSGILIDGISSFVWKNSDTPISGSSVLNVYGLLQGPGAGHSIIEGVDFSSLASGSILVGLDHSDYGFAKRGSLTLKNCKYPSGIINFFNPSGSIWPDCGGEVRFVNTDSSSTNYINSKYTGSGSQETETTIVRSGGATDGVTPISWKIVTGSGIITTFPFECSLISLWNDSTGSAKTITVYGVWGGGSVPNNGNIWIDVSYLSSSNSTLGSIISSGPSDLMSTVTALSSDSSVWGGSTTKFKMSVTFTPAMKGPIYVRVKVGLASSTFYIDPKVGIS